MGDPVIYNARTGYAIGERLDINCTSFQSRPAARLQWFINGKSVSSLNQVHYSQLQWQVQLPAHVEVIELELEYVASSRSRWYWIKLEALTLPVKHFDASIIIWIANFVARSEISAMASTLINESIFCQNFGFIRSKFVKILVFLSQFVKNIVFGVKTSYNFGFEIKISPNFGFWGQNFVFDVKISRNIDFFRSKLV